ncbi:MAG TPA: hypothetical protein VN030_13300 [Cellvibrio sp.]|nr:hypothetical protein [Cellvibrio sp.]
MFNYLLPAALIGSYPLWVHASLLLAIPRLQFVALVSLLLGVFGHSLIRGQLWPWVIFITLVSGMVALDYFSLTLYLLYLPPIVMPLTLFVYFGLTLLPGREPLISGIARSVRGTLIPAMEKYTRTLTLLWCLLFLAMTLCAVVLPLLQQPKLWSWITNVINYGIVGSLFIGEFILRKKLFPQLSHPSFADYIRIVTRARHKPE